MTIFWLVLALCFGAFHLHATIKCFFPVDFLDSWQVYMTLFVLAGIAVWACGFAALCYMLLCMVL